MKKLVAELYKVLDENILPFWTEKMIDNTYEGFIGQIDGNHNKKTEADKSIILNTRILWSFSAAHQLLKEDRYKQLAKRAFDYLLKYFVDQEFGGVYWMITAQGKVKDPKKQIYAQAFMIYALAEFYKFSKEETALNRAVSIFELIEQYSWDPQYKGYLEAFDRKWDLLEDLRLSDKDANEKKTMNTHLHILEAYTNLYRIWPDDNLKASLRRLIMLFLEKFIDDQGHFVLFFNEEWVSKSPKISYGHDIEGSWLLYEAAEVLGDEALLGRMKEASLLMADAFIKEGLSSDNGVYNELEHGQLDGEFHWWPQAEALVGLVNAWQLSGDVQYLEAVEKIWDYTKKYIIDWEHGEWFWGVDSKGNVLKNEDKAGPWKCPYHNSRALLEVVQRLGKEEKPRLQ